MPEQSWFTRPIFVSSTFKDVLKESAIPLPTKTNFDSYDPSDYLLKKNSRKK
jgi:hypothetical protein